MRASEDDLERVFEVGPKVALAIRQYFDQEQNQALVGRLAAAGVNMKAAPRETAKGPFTGKSVVVTGTIEGWSRDDIKTMLRGQGARVTESVSRKTDIVICGADAGSKLDKARSLGVRVMETDEFLGLAGAGK
jgi:DNA ligase (NAD+)